MSAAVFLYSNNIYIFLWSKVALKSTCHSGLVARVVCCYARGCRFGHGRSSFTGWGEKRKRLCAKLLEHVKDPQVVTINLDPFTAAHFVAQV